MKKQSIVRKIAMGIICLSMVVTSLGMSGFTQVVYASEEGDCSDCNATGKKEGEVCSACGGYGHLHNWYEIQYGLHYSYIEVNVDETSHNIKCTKLGCNWSMEGIHNYDDGDSGIAIRNECGVCNRACTHDMVPSEIIDPTCIEDGREIWICNYGCTHLENKIIPALGHKLVFQRKSGNDLMYECVRGHGCDRSVTLNVSAPSTTYSGNDNLASFDSDGISDWSEYNKSPLPTFTYEYKSSSGGDYVSTEDTKKVGYYKATIQDPYATFSIEYVISKATPTLSFTRLSEKSNNIQGAGVAVSPADDSANIIVEYQVFTPAVEGHACSMAEAHEESGEHTSECGFVAVQEAVYEWTTTAPTAIGRYPVRAYMPEGTYNLNALELENAVTGTYVIEQYVAPSTPSGGETGDGTTTETRPDGTIVETTTKTSADGTKTKTVVESNPDGSKTKTITEEKVDGTKTETVAEEKPDGSKSETITATATDGSTIKTTTKTSADGTKTEAVKETSADGKTSSSIEVKTDATGKVTESVVAVEQEVKGKKLAVDMSTISDMIARNDDATKKNTTVVLKANDQNGKEKFNVEVDAKNLKTGAKLTVYAVDKKGNPILVDTSKNNVTITENGEIKLKISGTGDFTMVTPKEATKIEKAIEKSVKPAKTNITVKQGGKSSFKLDSGCNKKNISKITYSSNNAKVKVNKNGKITVKGSGNATITAKVTLANGKTKTIKMKVKVK